MGRKPVLVLAGALLAGAALTGCQSSTPRNNSPFVVQKDSSVPIQAQNNNLQPGPIKTVVNGQVVPNNSPSYQTGGGAVSYPGGNMPTYQGSGPTTTFNNGQPVNYTQPNLNNMSGGPMQPTKPGSSTPINYQSPGAPGPIGSSFPNNPSPPPGYNQMPSNSYSPAAPGSFPTNSSNYGNQQKTNMPSPMPQIPNSGVPMGTNVYPPPQNPGPATGNYGSAPQMPDMPMPSYPR